MNRSAGTWLWDDVRFFLAVARAGSLSGAARGLGVGHVTVGRRIALFEKRLGVTLLKRTPDGFAFAMDCKGSKTILTFHFSKNLVAETQQNLILAHKSASSSILSMMRRVGDCPGQPPPGKETNLMVRSRALARGLEPWAARPSFETHRFGDAPQDEV